MMARRKITHIKRIQNTALNVATNWGERQTQIYVPVLLNAAFNKARKVPAVLRKRTAEHKEAKVVKKNQFMMGVEQGKKQKEAEMIQSMKNAGLSDEQISLILRQVSETEGINDSTEQKQPKFKVLRTKKRGAD